MIDVGDRQSRRLDAFAELARGVATPPTLAELERGHQKLRARTRRRAEAGFGRAKRVVVIACCALSLIVVAAAISRWSGVAAPQVTVQRIEGGKMLDGGYLAEQGRKGIELTFSEGSRFRLSPGSRGRLRSVSRAGARFALDTGTAAFHITPSRDHEWWVEAGPFAVSVRGTDFTVGWEPTSERFEIQLRHGRVAVSGPLVGDELILKPGQHLTVNLPKGETVITEAPASPVTEAPAAAAPAVVAPVPELTAPVPELAASYRDKSLTAPRSSGPSFREALANGEWDRILAEVERQGVDMSLRTLSSDDLFALADAARYRRRPDLARSALLAHRARFPGSARSLDALFLLGRAEELGAATRRSAIERYDEYLARAPGGTYAAEALGRKMILLKETEGTESARNVAREYLRRFPNGSHATAARKLQSLP
jgi:ferric-dicitrate binding protein FerR (iron transport regulator)/TolA-binding protein